MPHLRKSRERCGATCRDGRPCQAPAVAEALVCRRHGGAAPQVAIKARHRQLQMRYYVAVQDWLEARGTNHEWDALTRHGNALSALREYERKLGYLAELQDEVAERRAEDGWIRSAELPPIVRLAKLQRRAAELDRWKPRAGARPGTDPMDASLSAHARGW
jgi:hypothetical protein